MVSGGDRGKQSWRPANTQEVTDLALKLNVSFSHVERFANDTDCLAKKGAGRRNLDINMVYYCWGGSQCITF